VFRIAFGRIRNILGGQLRAVLSGGAPLNPETQRFMNICFCCSVTQGYGLTETCGGGTAADGMFCSYIFENVRFTYKLKSCNTRSFLEHDLSTGTVGPPLRSLQIMLREWKEGWFEQKMYRSL
jgi:long-chain acyl-CoA synthetase